MVVAALLVIIFTTSLVVLTGIKIHSMQRDILKMNGKLNTHEATMEYNRYLITRVDIVTITGCTVESLLDNKTDNGKILQYLTEETEDVVATIDPGSTGLYGYINGEYLDGSGWVPEDDYVPTERPWYRQTINSDEEITLVDPYLDAQTNTVMMTVARLLNDKKSVLAMDVSLAPIQKRVEEVSASTEGGQAFLLDAHGVVVAHSDRSQIGKNYMYDTETLGGVIAHRVLDEGQMQFEVDADGGNYVVYVDRLEGGWYSISLINSDVWHRPLHRVIILFSIIIALVLLLINISFLELLGKNIALQDLRIRVDEEEKRGDELKALSETDRMTGLHDRVSGKAKVDDILSSGSKGMFVELDIDHFKEINDTYGHQTGDQVILAVTGAISKAFRTNDVTMRMGGDEFGIFAVGIGSRELGEDIINRLFHRIERLEIPEMKGKKVCISAGAVLSSDAKDPTFDELYRLADEAMYESKKVKGSSLRFS